MINKLVFTKKSILTENCKCQHIGEYVYTILGNSIIYSLVSPTPGKYNIDDHLNTKFEKECFKTAIKYVFFS